MGKLAKCLPSKPKDKHPELFKLYELAQVRSRHGSGELLVHLNHWSDMRVYALWFNLLAYTQSGTNNIGIVV